MLRRFVEVPDSVLFDPIVMRHIVALSGGKDSTALALRLRELNPNTAYEYVCTPTGNELPEMIEHWKSLGALLGSPLKRIESGETLYSLIDEFGALPNNRMRWCTRILKIEPCLEYLSKAAPAMLYVGLRADEPTRAGGIYEEIPGIGQCFPMKQWGWGIGEVKEYLEAKGVRIPKRTDCAVCYHQRLGEWWSLWRNFPKEYQKGVEIEQKISEKRGKLTTFRNDSRDTWPASLAELARQFEKGNTPKGAGQRDMFDGGMCRACSL